MRVSSKHVVKILKGEAALLYAPSSQRCRLEWITSTGGTLNAPHNVMVDKTDTLNVSDDVAGIWGPAMRDQREKIIFENQTLSIDQLGYWYFPDSLNLAGLTNLLILQRNKDKYYTGAGTGAAAIWTPATAPEFTADEWISYWLVFSDRRFKITDNDTTTITVDLTSGVPEGKQALPGSTTAEIIGLVEWYPVRQALGFDSGSMSPMGSQTLLQSIFVSRIPVTGR